MISMFAFTCPYCGAHKQRFSLLRSLGRSVRGSCRCCGISVESVLGEGSYVLLLLYAHVLAIIAAFPFVLAVIGHRWLLAVSVAAVFALLVLLPAMAMHARSAVRCVQR